MTGGSIAQMFQAMLLGPWLSRNGSQKMGNLLVKPNQKDLIFMNEYLLRSNSIVINRHVVTTSPFS